MDDDSVTPVPSELPEGDVPAATEQPVQSRRGALLILGLVVVLLSGFFVIAFAPKGKPAGGLLPADATKVVGYELPDVRLPQLNGTGDLGLRDLIGKPIVINFWASWCVTCKEEAAIMGAAERKWRDKGVVFVGIDTKDLDGDAIAFAKQYGMDYTSIVDRQGIVAPDWGVTGYPETFFVDREGRIASKWISNIDAPTLDERITQIVGS